MSVEPDFNDKSEWLRCKPMIEAALEYGAGTHTIEDIENCIEDGSLRFFSSPNSAVIVEIFTSGRKKVISFFLAGGDLTELKTIIEPRLLGWAKAQGCNQVRVVGRPGWVRAIRDVGYKSSWMMVYKDI